MDTAGMSDMAENIVDAMSDGLVVFDDDARLIGWNPAAEELTGWSRERAAQLIPASTPDGRWIGARCQTMGGGGPATFTHEVVIYDCKPAIDALPAVDPE